MPDRTRFDAESFKKPDISFSPVYAWVWNDALSRAEIDRQTAAFADAGIRAAYIIPEPPEFRPNTMVTRLSPDYLSPEFMEYVRYAFESAESRGIRMWIYDEGGWPSGGACGRVVKKRPDLVSKSLRMKDGKVTVETANAMLPDLSEPESTETFIELTHEKYAEYVGDKFGGTTEYVFTDEPTLMTPAWPDGFEEKFRAEYGYDIAPFREALLRDAADEREKRARVDYYALIGRIYKENYFDRLRGWCHSHGLKLTGHIDRDHDVQSACRLGYGNPLAALRAFDVPGIDVITEQIMPGGGELLDDNGAPFFPRFASSAARQTGGTRAMSESFGVYGAGLTPELARYVVNYQIVRGINLFNFMTISYSDRDFLAYAERPSLFPSAPGFSMPGAMNEYVARMSYAASLGEPMIDTALLLPVERLMRGGEDAREAAKAFIEAGNALERAGIEFDIADAESEKQYKNIVDPIEKRADPASGLIPTLESSAGFENIRYIARRIGRDILAIVYNEGVKAAETSVKPRGESEARRVYKLDARTGVVVAAGRGEAKLLLESGEAAVLLFTDSELDAESELLPDGKAVGLTNFTVEKRRAFRLGAGGAESETYSGEAAAAELGPWKNLFGQEFSGEAVYRTEFDWDDGKALLSLGEVEYFAEIRLNGSTAGYCFARPFELALEPKPGRNTLEITVANTCANAFAFDAFAEKWEKKELGSYHERSLGYEKKTLGGGLSGPVKLTKLI